MGQNNQILYKDDESKQIYYIDKIKEINKKQKKFKIITYGCQMNVHDSENLSGMLYNMGYDPTESEEEADLIIINTCCVREHAEIKVYGYIGTLENLKKKKENMKIAICGCMIQESDTARHIRKRFPFVDIIFGTHNLYTFPEMLYNAIVNDKRIMSVWNTEGDIVEDIPIKRNPGTSAWVTIMYGCNNFCTYCIVPYVRGRERSRKPENVIDEIKKLVDEGYKEVTLLGQNVNSYGKNFDNGYDFSKLIRDINKIDGLYRIRFMTSHPKDLSNELIDAIAECDKVCKHIHLPVQSGSNNILKAMNRHYTKESYIDLVNRIRNKIPGIALTTDIIVGFPGETEEDFSDTIDLMKNVEFDSAFTFIYSKRTGTPASKMENQIAENEKKERLLRLLNVQEPIMEKLNKAYEGKKLEILIDEINKHNSNEVCGKTDTFKTVNFDGNAEMIGKIANVEITEAKLRSLKGKITSIKDI